MPTSLVALLVTLRSMIRSRIDLQLESLALRHQIGVLQCAVKKRVLRKNLCQRRSASGLMQIRVVSCLLKNFNIQSFCPVGS
jgi:hypothetical protein